MTKAKPCDKCAKWVEVGYIHDNMPDSFLCLDCLVKYQDKLKKADMEDITGDYCVEYVNE